ncbi:MAG: hypothetical protein Tsb007_41560 [Rhizobacter sp.]
MLPALSAETVRVRTARTGAAGGWAWVQAVKTAALSSEMSRVKRMRNLGEGLGKAWTETGDVQCSNGEQHPITD